MRLGTGPSGATLVRRIARDEPPLLQKRTYGLPTDEQDGATPFASRTVKDLIEEHLFERRRDLFSELSVVFMDTTSLSFTGAGGDTLGERGYPRTTAPTCCR